MTEYKHACHHYLQQLVQPDMKIIERQQYHTSSSSQNNQNMMMDSNDVLGVTTSSSSSSSSSTSQLIRILCESSIKDIMWRSIRTTILPDQILIDESSTPALHNTSSAPIALTTNVKITGYIRNMPLYVHSLMHISGVGTCKITSIESMIEPFDAARKHASMNYVNQIIHANDSK